MFEFLDVVLAFAMIAVVCFLLFKVYSFDRHMDDVRQNGQFAPIVFPYESREHENRRNRLMMRKYGAFGLAIFALVVYVVLRMNGTIGNIFDLF